MFDRWPEVRDVDEVLFGVLVAHVGGYLDAIDRLVVVDLADEARRLAAAWRALLRQHRPDGHGGCTGCVRPSHGRASICGIWRVANAFFVHRLPGDTSWPLRLDRAVPDWTRRFSG